MLTGLCTLFSTLSLYFSFSDLLPSWVIFLVIMLSNDIELNHGDYLNKRFSFFLHLETEHSQ